MKKNILESLLLTLFIFGLAGWIYIAGNAWFHPQSLSWPLTHLAPWPREDVFGIVCFAVSFVSFFFWNVLKENRNAREKGEGERVKSLQTS